MQARRISDPVINAHTRTSQSESSDEVPHDVETRGLGYDIESQEK